ncbi:carbohydrate-binding domain-containing protein [uncultured Parabacteroides sp.]|uniref:carbohydrate-binding domain-containing protein n=1 Tax=uncultured Parabacteroides sp. TaxID=512312 RepID=UPI00258288C7|nr:carbohydrate-binding domain-containing protein [uncultured Parabacteroides sp.]
MIKYNIVSSYLFLFSLIISILSLPSCSTDDISSGEETKTVPDDEKDSVDNSSFSTTVTISFDNTVTVSNPMADNGVSVQVDNGQVTVVSTAEEIEYILSGTTANGMVKIYSDYKFKLTFNGVSITNPSGSAVNIQSHKRVFVQLNDNTQNILTDGSSYDTNGSEDQKAAFFSEGQLIFNGNGSLTVNGNNKHAICSDDYVRIYEGNFLLTSKVSDGIHTNDAVIIDGGTLVINATKDAIECEEGYILIQDGNITIVSGDEGITTSYEGSDSSINPYMDINGGTIDITTTGTSAKGIKSLGNLTINGGNIKVKTSLREAEGIESKRELVINDGYIIVEAYDDCINAATSIIINGGDIYCYSTANDGIDSNGTLTITGGTVIAIGTSSPEDGFDCDQNTFKITGGTIIGVGGGTSTPTSKECTQPSLVYGGSGTQNTLFHISAADGTDVLTFRIPRTLQQMTLLFSSPSLASGASYTIQTGGTATGGTDFYGLYTGATYSGGTQAATFTTSSMVTTVGSVSGGIGGGGMGGGGGRPGGW